MHVLCVQFYLITKLKLLLEIYTSKTCYTLLLYMYLLIFI